MRHHPTLFRLSAALAVAGTAAGPMLSRPAFAQQVTASASASASDTAGGDPPARVGRLARISGTVSFHTADEDHWDPASLNYPITSGNAFWTEPGASAAIEIGATHIALDQQTEFDIDTLDNAQLVATEQQGAIYLRISYVNQGDTYAIRTPRGTVSINAVGRYEIVAGDTERPTAVTVIDGAAQVTGDNNLNLTVAAHQTATITGNDQFQGNVGPESDDPFLTAQLSAERPLPPVTQGPVSGGATASASATATITAPAPAPAPAQAQATVAYQPPPVVQQMTGASELENTGSWAESPQYGHVWYPPVERDWVPYRQGHWAYVAPWGWTWVDDASWGFAPFHYGRWVETDNRWGWVPVAADAPVEAAPCYSPALVDFVGVAAGVAVGAAVGLAAGLAIGGGGGGIGWVPLGYNEPYIPPYGGSAGYINRINSPNFNRTTNISNVVDQRRTFINNGTINKNTVINKNTTINNYYANAAAATAAPVSALQRGVPIKQVAKPIPKEEFARVVQAKATLPAPTAQTPGVTPAVARQHNIPLNELQSVRASHAVSGPPITPRPAGRVPLPATGRPAAGEAARPGQPVAGAAGSATRPGLATPPRPGEAARPGEPAAPRPGETARPGEATAPRPGAPAAPRPGEATARPGEAAPRPAAHPGLPALVPHNGTQAPPRPGQAAPAPAAPTAAAPNANRSGAPGPAITPRANGAAAPSAPGPAIAPRANGAAAPSTARPATGGNLPALAPHNATPAEPAAPRAATPAAPAAPVAPRPAAPVAPRPAAPPAPRPAEAAPRPAAPAPHPAAPAPAPAPHPAAPAPAPHQGPQQRIIPPGGQPQPSAHVVPQPRYVPPQTREAVRAAPRPTYVAPPAPRVAAAPRPAYVPPAPRVAAPPRPVQVAHAAPPPPAPRPVAPPRRACPAGHPVC